MLKIQGEIYNYVCLIVSLFVCVLVCSTVETVQTELLVNRTPPEIERFFLVPIFSIIKHC